MIKQGKKVQCVLITPLRGKGLIGDVISVKKGYARYLERFDKAVRATQDVLANIEKNKEHWEVTESVNRIAAEGVLKTLQNFQKITLYRRVSHAETLYSSVRHEDIIVFFADKGIKLNKESIKIDRIIKTLGEHEITITIYGDLIHHLIVEILPEG